MSESKVSDLGVKLHDRLRGHMKQHGLNYSTAAKELGLTPTTIKKWINTGIPENRQEMVKTYLAGDFVAPKAKAAKPDSSKAVLETITEVLLPKLSDKQRMVLAKRCLD